MLRPFPIIATLAALAAPLQAADPTVDAVLRDMRRVADWQLAHPSKHPLHDWTQAPFYLGLLNLYQVSGEQRYRDAADGFGKALGYGPGPRVTHADDHAVLQAWLLLHRLQADPAKIQPAIDHFPKIRAALANQPRRSVSGGTFTWDWCDALFMSPAVWVSLSQLTDNPDYLAWADREWWTCTDVLYDPEACLYYRDARFFNQPTPSGRKTFWARGNGWVCGGLAHVLDHLPADHPSRNRYLGLYHDMMRALAKLRGADGLWRSSLLDPEGPVGESSGSSFFTYAMAWGLNRGLLPQETYRPIVMKAWAALTNHIREDGMLGYVQRIDDRPHTTSTGPDTTEVYGCGAFLLAGAELARLLEPSKRRTDVARFDGVKLPDRYLPAAPRAYARFVPERKDDFAWENDLVAFRAYGPALRASVEDSGIDCWFKRVPYPILDKWYLEDVTVLGHSKAAKSYHKDQGEGLDIYKVGNSRGCGGISVFADGQLHHSNTFVGQRVIEDTPQRVAFELDYASDFRGQVLRETKRITLVMGERLFQCDSRFTLDGKPAQFEVAIGLMPQVAGTRHEFDAEKGILMMWETLEGLGVGTGVVIDPKLAAKAVSHTDTANQTQSLLVAKTDAAGHIRWFAGFGWEGQGEITSREQWRHYLEEFAARHGQQPYADPEFTVHTAPVP
jgi:rhamnogalacturonyl hydrolase YesR